MQWSEAIAAPSRTKLRQFAALCFAFFVGLGLWRLAHGYPRAGAAMIVAGAVLGGVGLASPKALRPVYTGWMVAAFPVGWTVSRLMLGAVFLLVFTPVAAAFKLIGRDVLRLRQPRTAASYWMPRRSANPADYLRQF